MAVGTQTQSSSRLLDCEQFIDHQLQRTRRRIRLTDVATAGLTLLVGFLGVLLLEVVGDHLVGMPYWLRRTILVAGLATASLYAALRLLPPVVRRINALYAAKTIEGTAAAFKNSLINYLELKCHRDQLPRAVFAALESRAVNDLSLVNVDAAVNQRRMMRMVYGSTAVVIVFGLYVAVAPRSPLDSVRRAFLADLPRPSNTQLVNIKPGDNPALAQVVAGDPVRFEVDVQGVWPERVLLHHSVDGGKFFAIKELSPGKTMLDPWRYTLTDAQQSQDYYFTGGDAESRHYRLEVKPAPTIVSISHDLDFPRYTRIDARKDLEGGDVEAPEGARVTIHARTNAPARRATIAFGLTDVTPASMDVSEDDPTRLTGRFTIQKSGTYQINFRTLDDHVNPSPVNYDIVAIADRPPTAHFILPDKPAVKVPANVNVGLAMTGADDHGVKRATLHVQHGIERPSSRDLPIGREPRTEFRAAETLDLAQLRARPGDTLTYWLTVRDNKEPASNRFETPHQIIQVIGPVAPEERKKLEAHRLEERRQFDRDTETNPEGAKKVPPEDRSPGDEQDDPERGAAEPPDMPPSPEDPRATSRQDRAGGTDLDEARPDDRPTEDRGPPTPDQIRKLNQAWNDLQKKRQQRREDAHRPGPQASPSQPGSDEDQPSASGTTPPPPDDDDEASDPSPRRDPPQPAAPRRATGDQTGQPADGDRNAPGSPVAPGFRDDSPPPGWQAQTPAGREKPAQPQVAQGVRTEGRPDDRANPPGANAPTGRPDPAVEQTASEPEPPTRAAPDGANRDGANPRDPARPSEAPSDPGAAPQGGPVIDPGGATRPMDSPGPVADQAGANRATPPVSPPNPGQASDPRRIQPGQEAPPPDAPRAGKAGRGDTSGNPPGEARPAEPGPAGPQDKSGSQPPVEEAISGRTGQNASAGPKPDDRPVAGAGQRKQDDQETGKSADRLQAEKASKRLGTNVPAGRAEPKSGQSSGAPGSPALPEKMNNGQAGAPGVQPNPPPPVVPGAGMKAPQAPRIPTAPPHPESPKAEPGRPENQAPGERRPEGENPQGPQAGQPPGQVPAPRGPALQTRSPAEGMPLPPQGQGEQIRPEIGDKPHNLAAKNPGISSPKSGAPQGGEKIGAPHGGMKMGAEGGQKIGAEGGQKIGAEAGQKIGAPQGGMKMGAEGGQKTGVEGGQKIGAPQGGMKMGAEGGQKIGAAGGPKKGAAGGPKNGTPHGGQKNGAEGGQKIGAPHGGQKIGAAGGLKRGAAEGGPKSGGAGGPKTGAAADGLKRGTAASGSASGSKSGPGGSKRGDPRGAIGGGGTGRQGGEPENAPLVNDETAPSPPAQDPNNPFGNDDVAPPGAGRSGPPLRRLADALKDADAAKELEERSGMTREQLELFVKRYERTELAPGREGERVEVKVSEQPAAGPAPDLPGAGSRRFSSDKIGQDRSIPRDAARGNKEGHRDEPPAEFRGHVAGYLTKLARSKATPGRRAVRPPQ